jgi:predicted amidohydrolase
VPAVGVATRPTRREVRSREHEQSGLGVGVAILAVAHRLFVRGLHVCTRGLVRTGHRSSVTRAGRVPGGSLISVRILLSALRCEKGTVSENLAAHRRVLCEGRDEGCELVVFPEMSLTGSLNPSGTPELLLTLDAPAVTAMAGFTSEIGVAAVFGISERGSGGAAFITQIVAEHGRIVGVQRKRHLGEGEEHYSAADEDATIEIGGVRCAIAICAESAVDRPFAHAAAATAPLVLLCAAPGLYGRRVDEPAWRRGWEWWRSAGLRDAQRHAQERGLWIAIATQAGSTHDEDFPGLAALVDPTGEVRAELPDWHEGSLVVDVPV